MNYCSKIMGIIFSVLTLTNCAERDGLAPVEELTHWKGKQSGQLAYRVVKGDTLFSIAFKYDQDYRQLGAINGLQPPYPLKIGQIIRLRNVKSHSYKAPEHARLNAGSRPRYNTYQALPQPISPVKSTGQWLWPAKGRIISSFRPNLGKKGIDIAGKRGDNIYAAGGGVVAYAGDGLKGYGNLIIIKHNSQYLTAYGNNSKNLVKEGQKVQAGQRIAEMGIVDRRYWGVHFEIRKSGLPVNPLFFLQKY
jgi:lipoprotein NlpD